jgi:hypothetical protein
MRSLEKRRRVGERPVEGCGVAGEKKNASIAVANACAFICFCVEPLTGGVGLICSADAGETRGGRHKRRE